MRGIVGQVFWDERYRARSLVTRERFSAQTEAEVCGRVLGARRQGP